MWLYLHVNQVSDDDDDDDGDTKFGENPLAFTQVSIWKQKYGWTDMLMYECMIDCRWTDTWTTNVIP